MYFGFYLVLLAIGPFSFAGSFAGSFANEQPLNSLWAESLELIHQHKPQKAREKLSEWLRTAEVSAVRSPSVYYNLATVEWAAEDSENAVTHLLMAANLRNWPWQSLNDFEIVSSLQKELGFSENPANQWRVKLAVFASPNSFLLLFFLGLWSLSAFALVKPKVRLKGFAYLCLALTFFSWITLMGLVVAKKKGGKLAVVKNLSPDPNSNSNSKVSLFRQPDPSQEKLLDFPPGALVLIDAEEEAFKHISAPVPGWIKTDGLREIN